MERILLYIISGETRASWNRAVELSKGLSATLYALFIVDKDLVKTVASMKGLDEIDTAIQIEEEGWKYLYYLEDMAVNEGVKTAIFVEEGDFIGILRKFVKERDIELLIVGHRSGAGIEGRREERMIQQLIEYVQCPILIEKEGGKR
jgi:nucleotide-binding universal stress UspA family protein